MVDVSGDVRTEFDDSSQPGGTGPTSALTQLARSTAAYLKGYQDSYGVKFYAVSLQNELAFDEFYNSCASGAFNKSPFHFFAKVLDCQCH
jgi:O-glycosyl hydrolase